MNMAVAASHEKLRSLQGQVDRLRHSDAMRKIKKIKRYIQKHCICFTLLGIIALVALSPFLLILAVVMAPLFFLLLCSLMAFLVIPFSFVFGFVFNCSLVVFTVAASCYLLYRITRLTIRLIHTCLTYIHDIASCPRIIYQYTKSSICELFSQLGFTAAQQSINVQESDSDSNSELEDIEPDYRDREAKLYEALVSRPQFTGRDTFEPFQY